LNIKPAVRVGVCQMDIQHVEKPLGSNRLSYSYSSSGKLANSSKSVAQNEDYYVGDTISVLVNRLANKPTFLRK